jgi:hypothetical protein
LRGERKVEKSNWYRTRGEENEIQRERRWKKYKFNLEIH